MPPTVSLFTSENSWIESDSVDQCRQVAALGGMAHVAGMPDLHPGKGAPIGAAMRSSALYPFLVGSDIGCGIAVFPIALRKPSPDRLAARFTDLDVPLGPDSGDPAREFAFRGGPVPAGYAGGLGTVGRGNHFVELARVRAIADGARAERLDLADGDLVLIVHSGSRGVGEQILRAHRELHGAGPSADPSAYLTAHDDAVRWGSFNRRLSRSGSRSPSAPSRASRSSTSATTSSRSATGITCTARAPRPATAATCSWPAPAAPRRRWSPRTRRRRGLVGRARGRAQDVPRRRPAARPGHAHGRGAAPHPRRLLRGLRRPAVAVRGGAQRVQAHRAGDRRSCRARSGHARGGDRAAGHLQDRRPRAGGVRPPGQAPLVGEAVMVHLMLSAGRGPLSVSWAVAELAARLEAEAGGRGVRVRRVESVRGDRPGTLRSVVLGLDGPGAEACATAWSGTLCWQAPTPYRPKHARKNWYVIARRCSLDAPRTRQTSTWCPAAPAGGQHRNKVSTGVRAAHRPTGLAAVVDTARHSDLNRRLAMQQLRERLDRDRAAAAA